MAQHFSGSRNKSPYVGSQGPTWLPPASSICWALYLGTIRNVLPWDLVISGPPCLRCSVSGLPPSFLSNLSPSPQKPTPSPVQLFFSWASVIIYPRLTEGTLHEGRDFIMEKSLLSPDINDQGVHIRNKSDKQTCEFETETLYEGKRS